MKYCLLTNCSIVTRGSSLSRVRYYGHGLQRRIRNLTFNKKKNAQEEILNNGKKNDRQKVLDELIERTLHGWKAAIFE